jgi:hypothetical protein
MSGFDSTTLFIGILSLVFAIVSLIASLKVIASNTKAMIQSNQIKAQENSLKYIYDRRTQLRNKLVWLSRFVHNNPEWCMLQIDDNNHPYALSDFQWGDVPKCSGDKFCNTILNELNWLRGEIKILFPTIFEKYCDYCKTLQSAYTTWMNLKDPHVQPTPHKYADEMSKAYELWNEIVTVDMPSVMSEDFVKIPG